MASLQVLCFGHGHGFVRSVSGRPLPHLRQRRRRPLSRRHALRCRAMVNVDVFSPSLLLGVSVIGSGVLLSAVSKDLSHHPYH